MPAQFEVIDANTVFGPAPTPAMDLSFDVLVKAISNHGIARACTLSTVGFCHNYMEGNAITLASCEQNPSLIPAATIDPRGFFTSSGDIERLSEGPFGMFRFFPNQQGWPLSYAPFLTALDKIETTGLPVMIGVGEPGQATALHEIGKGRSTTFIMTDVGYEGIAEAVDVMKQSDNLYMETHSLLASGALALVVREVGSGRLIFGSGCPGASLAGALRLIEAADLPESDKSGILAGNIRRLLKL